MDISALKKVLDQQPVCVEPDVLEEETCRWDGEETVDVSEYVEMDGTFVRLTKEMFECAQRIESLIFRRQIHQFFADPWGFED